MIIQCIKCSTRFRFDESLIEGEGVWVRCSRCREVFFQENPVKAEPQEEPVAEAERSGAVAEEPDTGTPDFDKTLDLSDNKEEIDAILAKIEETKKTLKERHQQEPFIDIEKESSPVEVLEPVVEEMHKPAGVEDKEFETVDLEADSYSEKPVKRGFWKPWRIIVLIVFINLFFGGLYVWLSPGMSNQVLSVLSSTFPMLGDYLETEKKPVEFHLNSIRLQNVNQRFVSNITAGQLRIIEGIAFNSSPYPVTRIQVKGELYDSNGVIITERLAYSGNLLTDDELATWSEEAMQKELDLPMGSDSQNLRIEPKGQIPFMIIFPHEPPGVATAKVSTAGGEKLLK
jgi:predicted Zn finger-like uncharacterized protein